MRKLMARVLCATAVAFLALAMAAEPALASDTDCPPGLCAFFGGVLIAAIPSHSVGAAGGAWTGNFAENVYLNIVTGVFTYVFDLKLTALGPGESVSAISTGLAGGHFDSTLDYGVVFTGGILPPTTPPVDDFNPPGFTFSGFGATIRSLPSNMDTVGNTYEFYAQSKDRPDVGQFDVQNGGNTLIPSLDPAPEPGAMLLFGTGILAFAGILRRGRQARST
jgi:hypothetical protein